MCAGETRPRQAALLAGRGGWCCRRGAGKAFGPSEAGTGPPGSAWGREGGCRTQPGTTGADKALTVVNVQLCSVFAESSLCSSASWACPEGSGFLWFTVLTAVKQSSSCA